MALADWTLSDDRFVLDNTHTQSGSSALLARTGYSGSATVTWDQSATDTPTAAQLDTSAYIETDDEVYFAGIFRYQDANNYYYVSSRFLTNSFSVNFGKVENGAETDVETLSKTAGIPVGAWGDYRFLLWESAGSVVGRVLVNSGSGWVQATDRDLYDGSPSFTGGGAVGFGFAVGGLNNHDIDVWIDDTKVYY